MKPATDFSHPIDDLLSKVLDGSLDGREQDMLSDLLRDDLDARRLYHDHIALHALFHWKESGKLTEGNDGGGLDLDISCPDDWPAVPFSEPVAPNTAWHGMTGYFVNHTYALSYLIAAFVLGAAMLASSVIYVSNPKHTAEVEPNIAPTQQEQFVFVGRVTGMKDCRWGDSETDTYVGSSVPLGRRYALASGLLEISYNSGAKVILEGPCSYTVDSDAGGYLKQGKLVARVEKGEVRSEEGGEKRVANGQWLVAGNKGRGLAASATGAKPQAANPDSRLPNPQPQNPPPSTLHSPLFTITTPTAVVTDLGTEFGIVVDKDGDTISHVFQGYVEVMPAGGNASDAVRLGKSDSIRVAKTADGGEPRVVRGKPSDNSPRFVRNLPRPRRSYLDLADIVAGGDGFGNARDRGIDPVTGGLLNSSDKFDHALKNDRHYHPVDKLPMIDGVFIPDGGQGSVQLDSDGHTFSNFPDTNGFSWHFLWSGQLPATESGRVSCWLNDANYAGTRHSVLSMTPNKGITFDLKAVRRKHNDLQISRFTAVAGNTEMRSINRFAARVSADLWVFVDGELRFSRTDVNSNDGAFDIDIPLTDDDRFMTLAATDAGNSVLFDWTIFGDPRLHVSPTMKNKPSGDNKRPPTNDYLRKGDSSM